MLKLSEVFYSLQGEGPVTGYPAVFVRFAGCNLNCGQDPRAQWKCDTWNVMRKANMEIFPQELPKLIKKTLGSHDIKFTRIVFTGGEPFLQEEQLYDSIVALQNYYGLFISEKCDIETNGTIFNKFLADKIQGFVMISPKLSNSGIPVEKRFKKDTLRSIFQNYSNPYLKFVISRKEDIEEIQKDYLPILEEVYYDQSWRDHVYLMPAMEDVPNSMPIKQLVWQAAMDLQVPMTMRAQIDTFGRRTGV